MKKYEVAPRFNAEIVERFNEEEIAIISGGFRIKIKGSDVICIANNCSCTGAKK